MNKLRSNQRAPSHKYCEKAKKQEYGIPYI